MKTAFTATLKFS